MYSDVDQNEVLIVTVNQWFDKSIFLENSIENLYYPSVDIENFQKYKKNIQRFMVYNQLKLRF